MRYRPFGRHGAAVSALSLGLTDQPMRGDQRTRLIYGALEAGINTFHVHGRDPAIWAGIGEALSAVERQMVFVTLRLGWRLDRNGRARDLSPEGVGRDIDQFLAQSRLGSIDVAILDLPEDEAVPHQTIAALKAARSHRRARMIGVAGAEAADPYIGSGEFDVLVMPYSLQIGWLERNRLRRAGQTDMAVIGADFHPDWLHPGDPNQRSSALDIRRLMGGRKEKAPSAYAFLEHNPGWTAEQICLGYALTEPALASVETCERDVAVLEALSTVVDRELPTGLAAQIEMARISHDQQNGALAKGRAGA